MSRRESASSRSGSLTAEDWVQAAREAVAEGGVGAVAVEPLARRLGVTKGSFYWHFKDREALLRATLERWEETTEEVFAAVGRISDPRERLRGLVAEVSDVLPGGHALGSEIPFEHAFDLAVSEAADDPVVQPVLRRVSERRIDHLDECYRALGFQPEEARYRALLHYAVYVGTLRLVREVPGRMPRSDEDYRAYREHAIAALMPEEADSERD